MDLAQILRELLRHRRWLVLGLLLAVLAGVLTAYSPTFLPPGLKERAIQVGAGETIIVLDSSDAAVYDTRGSLDPLVERAGVYASLIGSRPVSARIAEAAGIPPQLLTVGGIAEGEAGSEERGNQLVGEARTYRLAVQAADDQPLISVATQAPSAAEAIELADATAEGFSAYITAQQNAQGVNTRRRIEVRQLGAATGGLINPGANLAVAVLVAIAAFIGFCLLLLLASNVARNMRGLRTVDESAETETAPFGGWTDRRGEPDDPAEGDADGVSGTKSGLGLARR